MTRFLFASGYGGQIYTLSFNPSSSSSPSLSIEYSVSAGSAPTWLTQHPTQPILYTGDEFSSPNGVLSTFQIEHNSSSLSKVGGDGKSKEGPVHFVLSPKGNELYSACYSGGALSTSKLLEDGKFDLEKKGQNFVYGGKGQNEQRQEAPHAHGVAIEPTGEFLFCTDLGTDQVHAYKIGEDRIDLATSVSTTRGAGPRHLVFSQTSPTRSLLYLVCELSNTVSIYEVLSPTDEVGNQLPPTHSTPPPPESVPAPELESEDIKPEIKSEAPVPMSTVPPPPPIPKPTINPIQLDISILPPNSSEIPGDWTAAEIELSSDQKFLYVSNRAPTEPSLPKTDYMTILSLDEEGKIIEGEGGISYKEFGAVGARHFKSSSSSPSTGEVKMEVEGEKVYMAVAFQRTNEVVVYEVEGKELREVARVGGIEGATCVIWKQ
ncbi:hypothetical protein JCM3765_004054 [Sporobolomyces pararoseus]